MANNLISVGLILVLCLGCNNVQAAGEAEGRKGSPSSSMLRLGLGQGQFRIHASKVTLSGFSSGGTFAQMLQFSYSSLFEGIAVFSHNFYRCGPPTGVVDDYDRVCTKLFNLTSDKFYDTELVHRDIQQYASAGQIENVNNLRNKKLYVYAGLRSFLFTVEQSLNILKVYERYIQNPKAIRTRVQDAALLLPTNTMKGVACTADASQNSFIGNCGFSGAFEALSFLLNGDHPHNGLSSIELVEPQPGQRFKLAPLRTFDQSEFSQGIPNHNMDSIGLIYVPSSGCTSSKCLLHFYFHGCLVGRELNGTTHIVNSGYLELAELNQIIMVFPQALSSQPNNTIGCWDTFGIGGRNYATQQGPQIRVVKKILDKFLGNSGSLSPGNLQSPRPHSPHTQGGNLFGFGPPGPTAGGSSGSGSGGWTNKGNSFFNPSSSFASASSSRRNGGVRFPS